MRVVSCLALLFLVAAASAAGAGFTFLGPTPYLSRTDSPFPVDGSNPNFYLEDFEDGKLNTPGISQRNLAPLFGEGALGIVKGPSLETDSVDGDDGVIDGLGRGGHSLQSTLEFVVDTLPVIRNYEIAFDFDYVLAGRLPNAFGIIWTDGPPASFFSLQVTTGLGDSFTTPTLRDIGDDARNGDTTEDFFIGVLVPDGIASVKLRGGYIGDPLSEGTIEVDHLQYGVVVAEPISCVMALIAYVHMFIIRAIGK